MSNSPTKCLDDCTPGEWDAASAAWRSRQLVTPEPLPSPSSAPALWPMVVQDMGARNAFGTLKYSQPLRARNGRDFLKDAYQEALDLAVSLRGCIYERDGV